MGAGSRHIYRSEQRNRSAGHLRLRARARPAGRTRRPASSAPSGLDLSRVELPATLMRREGTLAVIQLQDAGQRPARSPTASPSGERRRPYESAVRPRSTRCRERSYPQGDQAVEPAMIHASHRGHEIAITSDCDRMSVRPAPRACSCRLSLRNAASSAVWTVSCLGGSC